MRRLPPMNSIRGFEAVVQLGSFTAAARERGVTQGAISRLLKIVEEFLVKRLFRPAGRGLVPTEWAEEYAMELRVALDRIEAATERIAEPTTRHVLRVNIIHTLAMRWLIPRLPAFQRRHPRLDVRITTSSGPVSQIEEPFDVAIQRAAMTYPGYESRVVDVLKSGRMVAPFKGLTIPCSPVHVLFPKEGPSNPRSQTFVAWLFEQGAAAPAEDAARASP